MMNRYKIDEPPSPIDHMHTAMILCVDAEAQWLMPGPVMWDTANACWEDESGDAIEFDTEVEYYWCYEDDLVSEALSRIAVRGN
jgi:hypothetical protein